MNITIVEIYEEKQKRFLCHRIDIFWVHLAKHNGWKLGGDWGILIEAQPHVNQWSLMGKDGLGGGESKGRR